MTQGTRPSGNPIRAFLLAPLIVYLLLSVGLTLLAMDIKYFGNSLLVFLPFAIFTYLVSAGFAQLYYKRGLRLSFKTTVLATCSTALFLFFLTIISEIFNGGNLFGQCITKGASGLRSCDYGHLLTVFLVMLFVGAFYGVVFWLLFRPQKSAAT